MNDSSIDFNYDMIIGQDLPKELGIVLDFSAETMIWHDEEVPRNNMDATKKESCYIWEDNIDPEYECIKHIPNVKDELADLQKYVHGCSHLWCQ